MITDTQTFGTGDNILSGNSDFSIAFCGENSSGTGGVSETNDGREARFVRVVSDGQTIELGFAAAFDTLTGSSNLRNDVDAEAVAGFSQSACDITPLMFCTPNSTRKADDHIGESVLLRTGGNGAGWGPGSFGFIDPSSGLIDDTGPCSTLNGSMQDSCLIAATQERTACFETRGVNVRNGQSVGVFESTLNIRFGIFLASVQSLKNNPAYAPAPNVISGYAASNPSGNGNGGNQCVSTEGSVSPDTVGLPPGDCHASGLCDRYGDADWSTGRAAYVAMNYDGTDPHPGATTRYDYYLAEIAAAGGGASTADIFDKKAETGRPQCSAYQSSDPSRRVLVAAAIWAQISPLMPVNATEDNVILSGELTPDLGFLGGPYTPVVTARIEALDFQFITPLGALSGACRCDQCRDPGQRLRVSKHEHLLARRSPV
ncbi:hypothetical protein ROG8370_03639 [Roseovarius gaetbuli]|uniref:Uncharacterized protein n=1 Tax=Roseovarius gaetbuli TaxID=1356575 RepID=A0A1X7A9Z5_9RHOB|nr:hypothetical protein [Roseovarius gaetbuli]SLN73907.1 hypothetical protein ROG8370_03639 [Roseovarius gaetbuli]